MTVTMVDDSSPGGAVGRDRAEAIERLFDRLEVLADLDDLSLGGAGGLATGVEIVADGLHHGPLDALDAFEPLRDLGEGAEGFDDFL
jgi:hypothetical protein